MDGLRSLLRDKERVIRSRNEGIAAFEDQCTRNAHDLKEALVAKHQSEFDIQIARRENQRKTKHMERVQEGLADIVTQTQALIASVGDKRCECRSESTRRAPRRRLSLSQERGGADEAAAPGD